MSKIGLKELVLNKATVQLEKNKITFSGAHGSLSVPLKDYMNVEIKDGKINLSVQDPENRDQRALWGTINRIMSNAIKGVQEEFSRTVWVVGTGYGITIIENENKLNFKVGCTHPVLVSLPEGMKVKKVSGTHIELRHIDKQFLHDFVEQLCRLRKVIAYSGKGIYADNKFFVRKKVIKK